jgi:amidase
MTRNVTDAAILLGALTGSDPSDPATTARGKNDLVDYAQYLDRDGLRGARIGVARKFFPSRSSPSNKVLDSALLALQRAGAELIDPIEVKSFEKLGDAEYQVLLYEFKDGINKYLSELGKDSPVRSLADLIQFNEFHRDEELPYFGQETFIAAQKKGPLSDPAYLEALKKCRRFSREEGIDAVMNEHRLDAIIGPSGGPAHRTDLIYGDRDTGGSSSPAAVAGYPSITVPAGFVRELPVGLSFFGRAFSEPVLLKLAYAFEQATLVRTAPRFLASLEMDESPSE